MNTVLLSLDGGIFRPVLFLLLLSFSSSVCIRCVVLDIAQEEIFLIESVTYCAVEGRPSGLKILRGRKI